MYKIMTAGPVQVRENVLAARSIPCTNPDQDLEFYEFYKETCDLFSQALHTDSRAIIMGGEGILGLEAACAGLTERQWYLRQGLCRFRKDLRRKAGALHD